MLIPRRYFYAGILAVIACSTLIAFRLSEPTDKMASEPVKNWRSGPIILSVRDIPEGAILKSSDIETMVLKDSKRLSDDALSSPEEAIGRKAAFAIPAGSLLGTSCFQPVAVNSAKTNSRKPGH